MGFSSMLRSSSVALRLSLAVLNPSRIVVFDFVSLLNSVRALKLYNFCQSQKLSVFRKSRNPFPSLSPYYRQPAK